MKLIFLDIDGVLNHNKFYANYTVEVINELREFYDDEMGEPFCPFSMDCLNKIIFETDAKIVLSSSKRFIKGDLNYMNKIWKNRGLIGEIIGITPHLYFANNNGQDTPSRGEEIKSYLNKAFGFRYYGFETKKDILDRIKESTIENYVIIDDDSDMLYTQRNNFVHIPERTLEGLNNYYADEDDKIYHLAKIEKPNNYIETKKFYLELFGQYPKDIWTNWKDTHYAYIDLKSHWVMPEGDIKSLIKVFIKHFKTKIYEFF